MKKKDKEAREPWWKKKAIEHATHFGPPCKCAYCVAARRDGFKIASLS